MKKGSLTRKQIVNSKSQDFDLVGKVSAKSVHKHTKKNWKQWVSLLIKAGAEIWSYQQIVAFLKEKHGLTPWWQQGVALGFEIATGRRSVGQDSKGKYMVTATKSISRSAIDVWDFLISEKGQEIWLQSYVPITFSPQITFETKDGFFGEIRTIAKQRRIRLFWQDPLWTQHTVLEAMVVKKAGAKCILVFNHTGIQDLKEKSRLKDRWRGIADEIGKHVSN